MRILLDSHVLLWWTTDDPAMSPAATRCLLSETHSFFVSSATMWEIATKFRMGRLPQAAEIVLDFDRIFEHYQFDPLPISPAHAVRAGLLPGPHKDPFDRMLIAQAQLEELPILSKDFIFDSYDIRRIWN